MPGDRQGLHRLLFGLAAASAIFIADQPGWTAGPTSPRRSVRGRAASSDAGKDAEQRVVRMTFVSTPWPQVLQYVASETKSTLVMHDVPEGRYTHRDLRSYTRTEAVQILNQELESHGYRILEKDEFLTVIQIQRARFEYPRHTARGNAADNASTPVPTASADIPVAADMTPRRSNVTPLRPVEPADVKSLTDRRSIQQAGFQAEEPTAPRTESRETGAGDSGQAVEEVTVTTKRPVTEVAQQLYAAFGDRVELIATDPEQLPAFRVYREVKSESGAPTRELWFILEMDSATNELHVHAPAKTAASIGSLIRSLDINPPRAGEALRLVPDAEQAADLAQQLNEQMEAVRRERRRTEGANPFIGQAEAPPENLAEPQPSPNAEAPLTEAGPEVLGNLRGDVSVEALADLDLLILRGNERDVDAVMDVIRKIEDLAVGATPGIRLHFLNSIDSEALATLLNDVYTRLTTLSTGTAASARQTRAVNVVAVGSPNAVLVLAPQSAMEDIVHLIEELDQPQAPGTEVEVFFLKNAVASQVVTLLEGFYEQRPGLGTNIRVVADARTNSVIVNASPKELAEVTKVIREVDGKQSRAAARLEVVQLRNALADELADFLNTIIQGVLNPAQGGANQALVAQAGAGANQALRDAKSMVLEFLTNDGAAQRIIRSGVLSDIRISGDIRSNTLTVTAPESSMPLLLELISVLDQPTNAVADIKAYTLQRADAETAAELLQSLFPETDAGQPGVQLAGAEGFGSSLIPFRVSVDARTNTVVYIGSPEVLRMAEAILFRIDQDASRNRKTEVLYLRNTQAASVATAMNQYLQSQRDLLQIDPTRVSTNEILEQEVIVTPEATRNNLIISATPQYFDQIMALAKDLDREPQQVMISALIVEVTLEDTDEFGIELGFQDSILFDRSVVDPASLVTIEETTTLPNGAQTTTQRIISQTGVPGFLFNNQQLGNNVGVNSSKVGTQGLSNFSLGRVNDQLGFGGLVLSASSESVSVLLRALAAHRHVQILSNPQVLALDNQLAEIQQGQLVPVVNGITVNNTTGAANPNVEQQPSGIILTVTPRISPEGQIVMEVIAEKSVFDLENGVPLFTDVNSGNTIISPVKDIATAITSAKVQDGQTVVIGGLITKTEDVIESKVPYLGDIPIIGTAFRFDSRQHRRTELLVFLTPRIIHGDADIELIKQVEMERMHFFEDEAEMLHGPLMGVPAGSVAPLDGSSTVYPEMELPLPTPTGAMPYSSAEPMILGPLEPQTGPALRPDAPAQAPIESPPAAVPQAPSAAPEPPAEPKKTLFRAPRFLSR
jgi:type II secretion system protein D